MSSRVPDRLDALLAEVAGGDRRALAEVYDATSARVYRVARLVLPDKAKAEEAARAAYLDVWRTSSSYDASRGSALAWVVTIAHRRALEVAAS